MGHHEHARHAHQRRQPDRRAAIIGEGQEGAAIGPEQTRQRDAVHRRRHAVFAHAVMDVAATEIARLDRGLALRSRQVRPGQVGRAADGEGQRRVDHLERHFAGLAGSELGLVGQKPRLVIGHRGAERRGVLREMRAQVVGLRGRIEPRLPVGMRPGPARGDPGPCGMNILGDLERRVVPAQPGAGGGDFFVAQRRAMHVMAALLVRCAKADHGAAGDHRGARVGLGLGQRGGDPVGIVPVAGHHVPARRREPRLLIGRGGQLGVAVDGDAVVVPHDDQVAEAEMPGKVDCLVADPLHQAAVTGDDIGEMVDQIAKARLAQPFRQRHADGGGNALPERPGGDLDALGVAVFRVPGGAAAKLAEGAQLVQPHVVIAQQVMDRVKQHRAVPGAQHEAVSVGPVRRRRIEREKAVEEDGGDIGHAHRHAGMARIRGLHRIHGQRPDGIGHTRFIGGGDLGVHCPGSFFSAAFVRSRPVGRSAASGSVASPDPSCCRE